MTLPLHHRAEYLALCVSQIAEEQRLAELVRVSNWRRRSTDNGSYVVLPQSLAPQGKVS